MLTQRLLKQDYVVPRLKSSLQKLYGRHNNLIDSYKISKSQMTKRWRLQGEGQGRKQTFECQLCPLLQARELYSVITSSI
jgi:hypothetical protein